MNQYIWRDRASCQESPFLFHASIQLHNPTKNHCQASVMMIVVRIRVANLVTLWKFSGEANMIGLVI